MKHEGGETKAKKIAVTVKTGARDERVEKQEDGSLKVTVKARPIEGKANDAVILLLAGYFSVPKTRIRLTGGERAKHKVFIIDR